MALNPEEPANPAIKAIVFDFPKTILDANHAYEGGWTDFQAAYPEYLGFPLDRLVDVHDTAAENAWHAGLGGGLESRTMEGIHSRYDHYKWSTICKNLGFMRCQIPDKQKAMKAQATYKQAIENHCREVHQSTIAVDELLLKNVEVGFFTVGVTFEHQPSAPWKLGFVAFKKTRHEVSLPGDTNSEKSKRVRKAAGIQLPQTPGSGPANAQGNGDRIFNDPDETVFIGVSGTTEMRLARQIGMHLLFWDPSLTENILYQRGNNGRPKPVACSNMMSVPVAVRELSRYMTGG